MTVFSFARRTVSGFDGLFRAVILPAVLGGLSLVSGCTDGAVRGEALNGQAGGAGVAAPATSFYAASRFLEHASMGPAPSMVTQLRAQGVLPWLDTQFALPATRITTPDAYIEFELNKDRDLESRAWSFHKGAVNNLFVNAPDQLRARVAWVLSNYLVVSTRKVQAYGASEYLNTLMQNAFGSYADLIKAVTRSPAMGFYLDNAQNSVWQLNENYGRELMQLFTVGLVQLNPDGSVRRDSTGAALETYTQFDVIEATRALSGWGYAEPEKQRLGANFANYGKAMVPISGAHDIGKKTVLGRTIPAGQSTEADLDSLAQILATHPNTAPFVSLRLIQGLTASNPSTSYLERVSGVFVKSGGQLRDVVQAILLDPEARAGDVPGRSAVGFGRIKEPHLLFVSVLRGLECQSVPVSPWNPNDYWTSNLQQPLNAPSVFNFYPPTHLTPGTALLAPEQKMLTSEEFNFRLWAYAAMLRSTDEMTAAGCQVAPFSAAAAKSTTDLLSLIGERYFRGAMPAVVQQGLATSVLSRSYGSDAAAIAGMMVGMAAVTPTFGVTP